MNYLELSQQFLLAVKTNGQIVELVKELEELSSNELLTFLNADTKRLPFWINLYNAYSIYLLSGANPKLENKQFRKEHFNQKKINIAGNLISLNDIEHGLLRRSKVWWSLGFIPKFRIGKFERTFRVEQLDNRIHFALNCGGKSCPPIRFYEEDGLEAQLELATQSFLDSESNYDSMANKVTTSRLLLWYLKDFNGKAGIESLLKNHQIIPQESSPKLEFSEYNWQLDITNFD